MESRGLSASTKIPSKNLCFGIELEVIVKLPASYKPKTGKTATGKPVPSTWYQAGRYILGTHRKWIKTKFVGEPITVIRSVDKRFWPIHPGEKDFHGEDAARDLDAWKDLLKEDPTLVDSDTRENWEDPKNSDSLDFHAWTLVADGTIGRPEDGYAFELVAPVLRYGPGSKDLSIRDNYGLDAIQQLYDFFKECGFTISISDKCSSHVHLSPELIPVAVTPKPPSPKDYFRVESAWTLQRLKNMGSAALYFEVPMRSLMAPSRRGNAFTQEFHSRLWLGKHYEEYFKDTAKTDLVVIQELQAIKDVKTLQDRMNPETRWWTWNYTNLNEVVTAPKQSLEFRWPAGSLICQNAWDAVDLAVAFTFAGCDNGTPEKLVKYEKDMAGLLSFIMPFARAGSSFDPKNKAYAALQKTALVPFVFKAANESPKLPVTTAPEGGMAQKLGSDDPDATEDGSFFGEGFAFDDEDAS